MKERAYEFGAKLNLVGILTEPTVLKVDSELPAAVILNAGLLHRVGPHRMSVILARRLAAQGVSSLRFDIGGRGDSESTHHLDSDENQVLADVIEAMDFLVERRGIRRFVLYGLCAGADNAHAVALQDPRVAGAVFLDGHGYWTRRSYMEHYLPRMWRPGAWINYARRSFNSEERPPDNVGFHGKRKPFGPREQVEREIQSLLDRNAHLLYVFSGGVSAYYNYADQFFHMFPRLKERDHITVQYYPNADHTYTLKEERENLLERVTHWYGSRDWK